MFLEAVLDRVAWIRHYPPTASGLAIPPTRPEYRLKMFVSKDPTVESRSNVFMCFRRLFSLEFCELRTTRRQRLVWAIPPTRLDYRLKMSVSKDPTVVSRSNFFMSFRRLFSMDFCELRTTRRQRPVWAIPPTRPEYRLKRFLSKDPTVGSLSNFFTCFWRLFSIELRGIDTIHRQRPIRAIPPTGPKYRLKMSVSKDPTIESRLNFFMCFRRLFSREFCEIRTTRRQRPVWAIPPIRLEYQLKSSLSKEPTVRSSSNFFTCFWRLFSIELHGIDITRPQHPV